MSTQTIKDAHFHIVGYIDTAADGKQTAKNAHYRILGYYDPKSDITKNAHYSIVGSGNQLGMLIGMG